MKGSIDVADEVWIATALRTRSTPSAAISRTKKFWNASKKRVW